MMEQINRTNKIMSKEESIQYNKLYDELCLVSNKICRYYEVDKIKFYSVYIYDGCNNVFDIQAEKVIFYDELHIINPEAINIISEIQYLLTEIQNYLIKIDILRRM